MSCHTIHANEPNISVTVGFDPPLNTFFAHVARTDSQHEDDGDLILWLGTTPGEIQNAGDLITPLAPYAVLCTEHLATLQADQTAHAGKQPTGLQKMMIAAMRSR